MLQMAIGSKVQFSLLGDLVLCGIVNTGSRTELASDQSEFLNY